MGQTYRIDRLNLISYKCQKRNLLNLSVADTLRKAMW